MVAPVDPKKEAVRKKVVVEEVADSPATTEPQAVEEAFEKTPAEPENIETPKEEPVEEAEEAKTETPSVESKEEPQPEPKVPEKPANRISPLWLILPAVILIIAFAGGIYVYQTGVSVSEPEEESVEEETIVPEASPEASPSATPNLSAFTIDIQNGSGIAGEATKVKTLLEEAGFKIGTAGNAKTYDYEKTIIQAKETVNQDFLASLTVALEKTYLLDENEVLPVTSSSEIIVIVGKTKAE